MCGISKDYKKRTYVAEGIVLSEVVKVGSTEFYEKEKRFPKDNKEAGLVEPNQITGQAVSSVAIKSNGRILITYNHKVFDGAELYLVPIMQDKKITWECRESDDPIKRIDLEILPHSCRSATMDKN
jgi:type IV pilus assembly protein PilA